MASVIALFIAIFLMLATLRRHPVDWRGYGAAYSICLLLITIGLLCRMSGRREMASTTIGLGMVFALLFSGGPLTYSFLPLWRDPIDPTLAHLDALLGFYWPQLIELASRFPLFVSATWFAYHSVAFQFWALLFVLGMTDRARQLQEFLAAIALTCLATIVIWAVFPAFGPSTLYSIDIPALFGKSTIVTTEYGRSMLKVASEGPNLIQPNDVLGLVAFPSYHCIMALLATWGAWTIAWARWPCLFVNLLVLPAAVIQGGHYVIDLLASMIVVAVTIPLVRRFVGHQSRRVAMTPALA